MSALASCNFKVSIESYVLAFMNDKLMHRRIKYHLRFVGGASYQSLALAIPKTSKAYEKCMEIANGGHNA